MSDFIDTTKIKRTEKPTAENAIDNALSVINN